MNKKLSGKTRDIKNIKDMPIEDLDGVCEEIRNDIISAVNGNGGHLSSNLGIVETVVSLFRHFDFPKDKIVFDVGHQCYAYKILSDRKDRIKTIRRDGGLSGFPDPFESEYDTFTSGHSGTSISSALGLCSARDCLKEDYFVIAVVGDGSLVNGLNLEALSSSNNKPKKFIVILNDNGMSISKNKNGLYNYISRRTTRKSYIESKTVFKRIFGERSIITRFFRHIRNGIKRALNRQSYFEKFGFKYVGVIDGNNMKTLDKMVERVKFVANEKAVFLHVKTTKGKGYKQAEERADIYHGVSKNCEISLAGGFSTALGNALKDIMQEDGKVVSITAGMKDGVGLTEIEKLYPDRFYDVGIAEEYAVTFAGGLATGGLKPVVSIYSTFLQRAYDEIIHDVCISGLPVVFCIDRAGLVGEDGKTHQGIFDLSYLSHIPDMTILCPSFPEELNETLKYALSLNKPVAIRYPKNGNTTREVKPYSEGLWEKLSDGKDYTVLAVGPNMVSLAYGLAEKLKGSVAVYSARSVKPLDSEVLNGKAVIKSKIITLEENVLSGGFGSAVHGYYAQKGIAVKIRSFGVKDEFIPHGTVEEQLKKNGLTVTDILNSVENF